MKAKKKTFIVFLLGITIGLGLSGIAKILTDYGNIKNKLEVGQCFQFKENLGILIKIIKVQDKSVLAVLGNTVAAGEHKGAILQFSFDRLKTTFDSTDCGPFFEEIKGK